MSIKTDRSARATLSTTAPAAPSGAVKALAAAAKEAMTAPATKSAPAPFDVFEAPTVNNNPAAKPLEEPAKTQVADATTLTPSQWATQRALMGVEATKANALKYGIS